MKTTFKPVENAHTGKTDYNFPAKLVGINLNQPFTNANGKVYFFGQVEFTYPNGQPSGAVTTQIFQGNLDKGAVQVGNTYLSTLSRDDNGNIWIRTSHLQAGSNVDADAFASLFDDVAVAAEVEAEG